MDEAKRNLHGMKTRALTIIGVEGDHVPLLVDCETETRDKQEQSTHQPAGTTKTTHMLFRNEGEGASHPLHLTGINFVVVRVGNRRQRVGPLGLCRPPCRGPPRSRPRPLPHARLGWCGGFRGGGGVERGTGSAEA